MSARGSTEADPGVEVRHARDVFAVERVLGLAHEPALQRYLLGHELVLALVDWVYIWGHWPVISVVLLWVAPPPLGRAHAPTGQGRRTAWWSRGRTGGRPARRRARRRRYGCGPCPGPVTPAGYARLALTVSGASSACSTRTASTCDDASRDRHGGPAVGTEEQAMTSPWTHEQLQHAIHEEVAAVVYAETHGRSRRPAVDEAGAAQGEPHPTASDLPAAPDVPTVVVGVDRSAASDAAVAWAAAEAVRRSGRLVLVRAEGLVDLPLPAAQWDEEERSLTALAASVRDAHQLLEDVTSELVVGAAGPVLVTRAADADLLVVGSHGRGAVSRAVLGSVSAHCAVHAPVPTVVVPRGWSTDRSRQR